MKLHSPTFKRQKVVKTICPSESDQGRFPVTWCWTCLPPLGWSHENETTSFQCFREPRPESSPPPARVTSHKLFNSAVTWNNSSAPPCFSPDRVPSLSPLLLFSTAALLQAEGARRGGMALKERGERRYAGERRLCVSLPPPPPAASRFEMPSWPLSRRRSAAGETVANVVCRRRWTYGSNSARFV